MGSIQDMLALLRERAGIILGQPSMATLYAFLTGYTFARKDSGTEDIQFLGGFGDFVHQRYRVLGTQGWAKIIAFQSPNHECEMKLFWKLLDEYVAMLEAKTKAKGKRRAPVPNPTGKT